MVKCKRKPVKCITTGEVFSSEVEAAEHYGISHNCISEACNLKIKHAGKLENGEKLLWAFSDAKYGVESFKELWATLGYERTLMHEEMLSLHYPGFYDDRRQLYKRKNTYTEFEDLCRMF